MEAKITRKHKILIADDSEMNRAILTDMLSDEYDIIEAEDGLQALDILQQQRAELSLILLDIVMPEMDGFGVLAEMNQQRWIEDVPVIMISAETKASHVERAYELGVTDFIGRPFDALIVHRRVVNTILLYTKQKKLMSLVTEQIYEKEQQSNLMIEILSHIVEFRNGESGMHVRRVRILTEFFLNRLMQITDRYSFTTTEIATITTASALHDIGKIAIPEEIINKPGRLTDEEFAVMKTHSVVGAQMLADLPIHYKEPLVETAYQICRHHHERYDGGGYPDGLAGDAIPICAQVVSLADVYDALTSDRVYKKAIPHKEAIGMIVDGRCGSFNPLLLRCLADSADIIETLLDSSLSEEFDSLRIRNTAEEILRRKELTVSERTLQLLEQERMKNESFATLAGEIQFEYTLATDTLVLSRFGSEMLGLPELVLHPLDNVHINSMVAKQDVASLSETLQNTSPQCPDARFDFQMRLSGNPRWFRVMSRSLWSDDDPQQMTGVIGKAIDIHDSRTKIDQLERLASTDALTGLLNHNGARKRIERRLKKHRELRDKKYVLAIFDLDCFKSANDSYGHMFGDRVLAHTAKQLSGSIRRGDIAARAGGDEFLLFMEYQTNLEECVQRIFHALTGEFEGFSISLSMGIAKAEMVGYDYDALFQAADKALYAAKRAGRGKSYFYTDDMKDMLSVISPIDDDKKKEISNSIGGR